MPFQLHLASICFQKQLQLANKCNERFIFFCKKSDMQKIFPHPIVRKIDLFFTNEDLFHPISLPQLNLKRFLNRNNLPLALRVLRNFM